jgi:hypothetical protein
MNHAAEIEERIAKGQDFVKSRHAPEAIAADWIRVLQVG